MNLKFLITSLACKALSFVAGKLGGGTDRPGIIALKLYPRVLRHLKFDGKIIAVTGSNGKTTTSNLIAQILRTNGHTVVNNEKGSNLTSGITTTLLCAAGLNGRVKADFVVLEVDECYARFIFEDVKPDCFLVLNLLRDQVVRNGNPDLVYEKIAEAIAKVPNCTLLLNANEPISMNLAETGNPCLYFAMDRTGRSTETCISGTHDAKLCPHCFHPMAYDFYHYNHLGRFRCTHCDYASRTPDYIGTDVDFANRRITVNGTAVDVNYATTFNMFNTVAAAAAVCSCGLSLEQFAHGAGTFHVTRERQDSFAFDGRKTVLMMTKQNAASLDQSIAFVLDQPGEKSVVIYINNVLYLDYKDISWLYDVAFERLHGQVNHILLVGNRALDAAVCVKAAGFTQPTLVWEVDSGKTVEAFRKTTGDIYILAASAFGNESKILEVLKREG